MVTSWYLSLYDLRCYKDVKLQPSNLALLMLVTSESAEEEACLSGNQAATVLWLTMELHEVACVVGNQRTK